MLEGQNSFTPGDYYSQGNARYIWFDTHLYGDSLFQATIRRYRLDVGWDEPTFLQFDTSGDSVEVKNIPNPSGLPTSMGVAWSNSLGYLSLRDTAPYLPGYEFNALSKRFDYHRAKDDSVLWSGEGIFEFPSTAENEIYVNSKDEFWLENPLDRSIFSLNQNTGDTTLTHTYDSLSMNYPYYNQGYLVSDFYFFGNISYQSDTILCFVDLVKKDSVGNNIGGKSVYHLLDLKDLSQVNTPVDWDGLKRFTRDGRNHLYNTTILDWSSRLKKQILVKESILTGIADTLAIIDSLSIHPDTNRFPVDPLLYDFQVNGDYYAYIEGIRRYVDSNRLPGLEYNLLRLRTYHKGNLLYEQLIADTSQGYYDTEYLNMHLFSDGRIMFHGSTGFFSRQERIYFIDTMGSYGLSINHDQEQSISNNLVQLYPTATNTSININAPIKDGFELRIYSITGALQWQAQSQSGPLRLDVSDWQTGRYLLVYSNVEGYSEVHHFIKHD